MSAPMIEPWVMNFKIRKVTMISIKKVKEILMMSPVKEKRLFETVFF